jgi:hypothetical protein
MQCCDSAMNTLDIHHWRHATGWCEGLQAQCLYRYMPSAGTLRRYPPQVPPEMRCQLLGIALSNSTPQGTTYNTTPDRVHTLEGLEDPIMACMP